MYTIKLHIFWGGGDQISPAVVLLKAAGEMRSGGGHKVKEETCKTQQVNLYTKQKYLNLIFVSPSMDMILTSSLYLSGALS